MRRDVAGKRRAHGTDDVGFVQPDRRIGDRRLTMVTVRYFAAREAAGTPSEQVSADSTGSLIVALTTSHGARMADVLAMSSLLTGTGWGLMTRWPPTPVWMSSPPSRAADRRPPAWC